MYSAGILSRQVYGVFNTKTFEASLGADRGHVGNPPSGVDPEFLRVILKKVEAAVVKSSEFVVHGEVESPGHTETKLAVSCIALL